MLGYLIFNVVYGAYHRPCWFHWVSKILDLSWPYGPYPPSIDHMSWKQCWTDAKQSTCSQKCSCTVRTMRMNVVVLHGSMHCADSLHPLHWAIKVCAQTGFGFGWLEDSCKLFTLRPCFTLPTDYVGEDWEQWGISFNFTASIFVHELWTCHVMICYVHL